MKKINSAIVFTLALLFSSELFAEAWSSANPERYNKMGFDNALWVETFEGNEKPFTVEYIGGAEGTAKVVDNGGRNGRKAMHIVKTNDKGYMVIRFNKPIKVKAGDKLQLNCFYQGKNADFGYSRALLRMQKKDQKDFRLFYFSMTGGPRMQEILNTPPDTWERKFTHRPAEKGDTEFYPALIIWGSASESLWDDFYAEDHNISLTNWRDSLQRRPPEDFSKTMMPMEELNKFIASDIEHTGKVVTINGKSRLLIDGKITAPVINGPSSRFEPGKTFSNAKLFSAQGIDLTRVGIRLGNTVTNKGFWKGKDDFDVEAAVTLISNTLRMNPKSRIILSFMLYPYSDFCKDFPSEMWIGQNGTPLYGNGGHLMESQPKTPPKDPQLFIWPSYYSEILLDLYKKQMDKVIAELIKRNLSKAIVGIHIGGGHDNQMASTHFDYSAPALRAFRKYLREIYKDEKALQKAWNDPGVTFETAQAPKFGNGDHFTLPKEQNKLDFHTFNNITPWRVAGEFADHVKKAFKKDIFSVRWCMCPFSGNPATTLGFDDFLRVQKFDALCAQANYNRRPPSMPCAPLIPLDSFHKHGKLYINEFDIRTWNAAPSWEREIMSITWGLIIDPQMWQSANRKLAGSMFANDMGFWYLDMAPGWFNHDALLKDIGETNKIGQMLFDMPVSKWQSDVAFVVDGEGMFMRNLPGPQWMFDMEAMVNGQLPYLAASGVPYKFYMLSDLLEDQKLAESFKVIVFAGMVNIDARRMKLLNSLKNSSRTLIFLADTGRLGNARAATGFDLKTGARFTNPQVYPVEGVKESIMQSRRVEVSIKDHLPPQWYDWMTQVYILPQKGDKVIARYVVDNKAAIAEHQYKSWKAVSVSAHGALSHEYFNTLVRQAGAYRTAESGYQCETNGNFLSIHCLKGGKTTFYMPYKCDAENLFNGKVHKGVTEITVDSEAGSTYWFKLTPAK